MADPTRRPSDRVSAARQPRAAARRGNGRCAHGMNGPMPERIRTIQESAIHFTMRGHPNDWKSRLYEIRLAGSSRSPFTRFDGDCGRADRARRFGSRTFQSNQPQWAICRKNHASFPFALFARCFAQPDRAVGHRSRRSAQWWLQRLAHANRERRSRGSRCGPRPAHTGARPHLSTEGGVFWLNRRLNSSLTARNFSVSLGSSR